ncbi:LAFA_0F17172g1_1 [Lachancea sp. 'fantastica']|nr:LAFA_0F17172g1_1 [Lachancea sp. 'fantastica']
MPFVSKRRLRIVVLVVGIILLSSITARVIVQFQLGKEIDHYKTFFKNHKDTLNGVYDPLSIKQIPYETLSALQEARLAEEAGDPQKAVKWDSYAYVNYATDPEYLCNTLVLFRKLKNLNTRAKLVALVSRDMLESENSEKQQSSKLLLDKIVQVSPQQVVVKVVDSIVKPTDLTPWSKSLTKMLVFNQTEYERVVYLDSDAQVSNSMDELFFLPPYVQFAAPLTYWSLSRDDYQAASEEIRANEKKNAKLENVISVLNSRVKKQQPIYNHLPSVPNSLCFHTANIAKEILDTRSSASPIFNFGLREETSKIGFNPNLMVIKPSAKRFEYIVDYLLPKILNEKGRYDTELINAELYNLKQIVHSQFMLFRKLKAAFVPEVMALPFGEYGLLTSSIRNSFHRELLDHEILGYENSRTPEQQSLQFLIGKSKYIHYSESVISKPWYYNSFDQLQCHSDGDDADEAEMCKIWNSIYKDFWDSKKVCEP